MGGGLVRLCVVHAAIALGRFLVGSSGAEGEEESGFFFLSVGRLSLDDEERATTGIRLHCPCGVVDVSVPVTVEGGPQGRLKSDSERPVSFYRCGVLCYRYRCRGSLACALQMARARTKDKRDGRFLLRRRLLLASLGRESWGFSDDGLTHSSNLDALSRCTGKSQRRNSWPIRRILGNCSGVRTRRSWDSCTGSLSRMNGWVER